MTHQDIEMTKRVNRIILIFFLIFSYLTLFNLANTYFWDDEAQVATIAKNYLAKGELTGWDGRNLFAYRNGAILDSQLRIINPPLDFLIAALSFKIFGVSTWSGRFPFAIAGLTSFWIFFLIIKLKNPQKPLVWLYSLGIFSFSVQIILYFRQCRYYALTLLFSLLIFLAYEKLIRTRKLSYMFSMALAMTALFYSHYLTGVAFFCTMLICHLFIHYRSLPRETNIKFFFAFLITLAMTIPYAIHYSIWIRPDMSIPDAPLLGRLLLLKANLREINLINIYPLGLFIILLALVAISKTREIRQPLGHFFLLSIGYVLIISLLTPQSPEFSSMADIRYLIPIFPFLIAINGCLLAYLHQRSIVIGLLAFILLIISNIFSLHPYNRDFRWLLPAYIHEINNDYPTCYSMATDFLKKHASRDEYIFAYPNSRNFPLMFYLGDRLKVCCLLNKETILPREQINNLDSPLYIEDNQPDYFISFGFDNNSSTLIDLFAKASKHQYKLVQILDVFSFDTSRPELFWHTFGPIENIDTRKDGVYIFRQIRPRR